MTAATEKRTTNFKGVAPTRGTLPIAASVAIIKGTMVGRNASNQAVPVDTIANGCIVILGKASASYDNTAGAAGAFDVEIEYGIFEWENLVADPITVPGVACFAADNQSVAVGSDGATRPVAGFVVAFGADGIVWVYMGPAVAGQVINTSALATAVGTLETDMTTAEAAIDVSEADIVVLEALPDVQIITADDDWTKPAGATQTMVYAIGGGGGGGSGGNETSDSGGGAGAGGSIVEQLFATAELSATHSVVIGPGGAGGAAKEVDGNGNDGTDGTATTFGGTLVSAPGGAKGVGGTNAEGVGGAVKVGLQKIGGVGGAGNDDAVGAAGGRSFAAGGGGGGGGISGEDRAGGAGGGQPDGTNTTGGGGTAGTSGGGAGAAGDAAGDTPWILGGAGGGGGGGRDAGGNGGVGGAGGLPGGGGGGGGSGGAAVHAGAGGAGANGLVVVISI